jgi:DNA repair protein RadC
MTIRHWPAAERPREKLLERGAHALSDAELLALLLGSGTRGRSAVEVARTLIAQFGSLRLLLNAEADRCLSEPGIGPARYAILKAALELARRHFREALRVGPALAAPEATRTFLLAQLRDRPYEVFCCLYLDLCVPQNNVELGVSPLLFQAFRSSQLHITTAVRSGVTSRQHRFGQCRRGHPEVGAARPGRPAPRLCV